MNFTTIQISMASKLAIFLIFSLFEVSLQANGFKIDLIHRDSDKSPFYSPLSTFYDQLQASINRSISRAKYFQNAIASKSSYQSNIIPDTFEFLMKINVGTPPKTFFAIVDTGSDLVWISCNPCDPCYKQDAPRFEPKNSSTYSNLPCTTKSCSYLVPNNQCNNDICQYNYKYGDGSSVTGLLASDTFTFDTSEGSQVGVNVSFGCSHKSHGSFDSTVAGIVGLGSGRISLISQLSSSNGRKFSYCLVPRTSNNVSSKLIIGSNDVASDPNVQSAYLNYSDSFYNVELHVIKIEDKDVTVKHPTLVLIDSGTTINFLSSDIVPQVVSILEKTISLPRVSDGNFPLCYDARSVKNKTIEFPSIDFKLGVSGEATIKMGPNNAFLWAEGGKACLAIVATNDIQIIGNIMQQILHVGFDLDESKVYFAPADCTKL